MRRSLLFSLVLGLVVALPLAILAPDLGRKDLVAYWSAANLLLHGQNPYDPQQMETLQQAVDPASLSRGEQVINVWNPPWLLIALLPLAALPFKLAVAAWMWLHILLTGLATALCLDLSGLSGEGRPFLWSFTACLLFGPALFAFVIGQVSILVLLGIVAGAYCLRRGAYPLAGALFVLATIKPHVAYLALAWAGWWVLRNRKWSVLLGAALTIGLSLLVASLLYQGYIQAYLDLLVSMQFSDWYNSTLWSLLEALSGQRVFPWLGLLLLPLVIPLQPSASQPDWLAKLGMLLAASLALAPYAYLFDHILLLPVIVQIIAWVYQKKLAGVHVWLALAGLAGIYAGLTYQVSLGNLPYYAFFWLPFALWGLYGYCYWRAKLSPPARLMRS